VANKLSLNITPQKALCIATLSVTLLVNIIFLLAIRERISPVDSSQAASSTAIVSNGAFSVSSLVDTRNSEAKQQQKRLADDRVWTEVVQRPRGPLVQELEVGGDSGGLGGTEGEGEEEPSGRHGRRLAKSKRSSMTQDEWARRQSRSKRWRIVKAKGARLATPVDSEEAPFVAAGRDPRAAENRLDWERRLGESAASFEGPSDKNLANVEQGQAIGRSVRAGPIGAVGQHAEATPAGEKRQSSDAEGDSSEMANTQATQMESTRGGGGASLALAAGQQEEGPQKGQQMRQLNIRVKSSRNHVFISVDNSVIYESGAPLPLARQKVFPNNADLSAHSPPEDDTNSLPPGRPKTSKTIMGASKLGLQTNSSATAATRRTKMGSRVGQRPGLFEAGETRENDYTSAGKGRHNEEEREQEESSANKLRGIHVVVLNQFDGSVMSRRTFDTYTPGQDEELSLFLRQLRHGRLVIFAVQDEASFRMGLQSPARSLLKSAAWSSRSIGELAWRDMWTFVARYGHESGPNLAELLTKSPSFSEWAPDCELQVQVELEAADRQQLVECNFQHHADHDDPAANDRRRAFCQRVEGYGRVCDCKYPAPISLRPEISAQTLQNYPMGSVPIVVIASNRPYYLYRMLRSLLLANGVQSSLVTIFVDGFYEEPVEVAKLFNLRVIQQRPMGTKSARISHHYKTALALTFEQLYPQAQYVLIFEEDLDIARDTLIYFNQTIALLERDPSLYCASAWNDQGYEHSVAWQADGSGGTDSRLLRIETMPGLGWLLSRRLFREELEPNWPSFEQPHDWDMWIRTAAIRKGRECVIPELSRTFHFGSSGTNINSYFQRQYFSKHAFNLLSNSSGSSFGQQLEHLQENNYEQLIDKILTANTTKVITRSLKWSNFLDRNRDEKLATTKHANGTIINHDRLPVTDEQYLCSLAQNKDYFTTFAKDHNYLKSNHRKNELIEETSVIYIKMIGPNDYSNWLKLARCWHLWDLDARGQHKSMWRLHLVGHQVLVIGSPASTYSKRHKPQHLEPFDLST